MKYWLEMLIVMLWSNMDNWIWKKRSNIRVMPVSPSLTLFYPNQILYKKVPTISIINYNSTKAGELNNRCILKYDRLVQTALDSIMTVQVLELDRRPL